MPLVATSPYFDALTHLPPGGVLRFDGVSWDDYEQLLRDVGDYYRARIFYDRGKLEIISPMSRYERAKSILGGLVKLIDYELGISVESIGSTTIREKMKERGAEPDDSFYVGRIDHILGSDRDLDFKKDPPPDVVIEIDHTNASLNKFSIYAKFGVREIWRAVRLRVRFYVLAGSRYEEVENSSLFPFLSAATLSGFLKLGMEKGESHAVRAFRAWLGENAPKAE
jgi:Uma2 family endonuclease